MAIGVLSCVGYHIKPQIFIVFIAIVIVECMDWKSKKISAAFLRRGGILYALAGIILITLLYNTFMHNITEQLDSEKKFGITHYAMMGLNSVNNGSYLSEDVLFSDSFPTISERTAANMDVIGQRLQDMGVSGLGVHLARKLLTNFGDGTFAWKNEGEFFKGIYEQKNSVLSPLLRNIIWGSGKMNILSETVRQGVWICVLAASLGLFGYKKTMNNTLLVTTWSIVGLILFELLFEARARYLYIYVPFFIITGVLGIKKIINMGIRVSCDIQQKLKKTGQ